MAQGFLFSSSPDTHPIRVLVADPQHIARLGTVHVLGQQSDIEVVADTGNVKETLTLLRNYYVDVLITEVAFPETPVSSLIRILSEIPTKVSILLLTADLNIGCLQTLLTHVAGCITKMSLPGLLVESVRAVARGERDWLDPYVSRQLIQLRRQESMIRELRLTKCEKRVLRLLSSGSSNSEIGIHLGITESTVSNHFTVIFQKLGVDSRAEATAWIHMNRFAEFDTFDDVYVQ